MDGKISSVRCLPVAKFSKRSWLVALDQDISIYESLCGLIGFSQVLSHGFQSYHQVRVVELLEPNLEGFCGTVAAVSLEEDNFDVVGSASMRVGSITNILH